LQVTNFKSAIVYQNSVQTNWHAQWDHFKFCATQDFICIKMVF